MARGENLLEGVNAKGIDLIDDKILEKYTAKKKETLIQPLENSDAQTFKLLKDLEKQGYKKEGTGFYRDAEHHLWRIEKDGDAYKLIRLAEEEDNLKQSKLASKKIGRKLRVFNIDYETDGEKVDLPKEFIFDIIEEEDADFEPEFEAADLVNDETGWLVNSLDYEWVKKASKKAERNVTVLLQDGREEVLAVSDEEYEGLQLELAGQKGYMQDYTTIDGNIINDADIDRIVANKIAESEEIKTDVKKNYEPEKVNEKTQRIQYLAEVNTYIVKALLESGANQDEVIDKLQKNLAVSAKQAKDIYKEIQNRLTKKTAKKGNKQAEEDKPKPESIKSIWENPETFDKYTIVLYEKPEPASKYNMALGLSEDLTSQGFSQFSDVLEGTHLGKEISWEDLSDAHKDHIIDRLADVDDEESKIGEADIEKQAIKEHLAEAYQKIMPLIRELAEKIVLEEMPYEEASKELEKHAENEDVFMEILMALDLSIEDYEEILKEETKEGPDFDKRSKTAEEERTVGEKLLGWDVVNIAEGYVESIMEDPISNLQDYHISDNKALYKIWIQTDENVEEFMKQVDAQGLQDAFKEAITDATYQDSALFEMDWDADMANLSEILEKKNPEGHWYVTGKDLGWMKREGYKYVDTNDGAEFIREVAPKTSDFSFEIFDYGTDGLYMKLYHHDAPTGESYYVIPAREEEPEEEGMEASKKAKKTYFYAKPTPEEEKAEKYTVFETDTGDEDEDKVRTLAKEMGLELAGGFFTDASIPYNFEENYTVIPVPPETQPTKRPYDIVDFILAYESGDMTEEEMIKFFQEMYDSGVWKSLQGHYHRMMHDLIDKGLIKTSKKADKKKATYFVFDDATGGEKETTFDDFEYFAKEFGIYFLDKRGKEISKEEALSNLNEVSHVYNPQGIGIARNDEWDIKASKKVAISPPGWENIVKKMKEHPEIESPHALSWWLSEKGYKPKKKSTKVAEEDIINDTIPEGIKSLVMDLVNEIDIDEKQAAEELIQYLGLQTVEKLEEDKVDMNSLIPELEEEIEEPEHLEEEELKGD